MNDKDAGSRSAKTKKGNLPARSKRKQKEDAPTVPTPSPTFTVRPTQELLPRIQQLARDMGRSEAQLMQEGISDLLSMIESGCDYVPPLVQRARLWREGELRNQKRQLGGGMLPSYAKDEIFPSECVRNLSPDLVFLPVYTEFGSWLMVPEEESNNELSTVPRPSELVGISLAKRREAIFGIKIDLSQQERPIDGVQPSQRSGDILLVAPSPELEQFLSQNKGAKTHAAWKQLGYLAASRSIIVGSHFAHGAFVASLHLPDPNEPDQNVWLAVPAREKSPHRAGILLEECDAVAVVVQQILVPGSSGLSF